MSYRGGGRSGGRGRGRSGGRGAPRGGGRGGPPYGGGGGRFGADSEGPAHGPKPHLQLCRDFTSKGSCSRGASCHFKHVIQMHKTLVNSDPDDSRSASSTGNYDNRYGSQSYNSQKKLHPTSDVALWNDPSSSLKIFTASHDGHWRLYNTANGFNKEVQHNMGGKVNTIMVESNFLFCGFEGTSVKVPGVTVGMIFAWNLGTPGDPPIELHMHETAPYAHASGVTCFITKGDMCVSGGHDSAIRMWKYDAAGNSGKGGFKLVKTLFGHAGEITGLLIVGTMLWSCSTDMTIRLWDSAADWECKYLITQNTPGDAGAPPVGSPQAQQQQNGQQNTATGIGHTDAITGLLHFESAQGNFVLSSSLDGSVKVWDSTNGNCLSTTDYGVGVISMALTADTANNALLIAGTVYGKIVFRSLLQTANTPPMCYLCHIEYRNTQCGHEGPVKSVVAGPSNTFYTAGDDGNVVVFQITGDFGL
mmetsp:Transcript_16730/g.25070  ORF Transcript_16730/g.25070 Transcript_16730/m.25070 type:complete len:475 (+) Transcript_16730:148-1572(+)